MLLSAIYSNKGYRLAFLTLLLCIASSPLGGLVRASELTRSSRQGIPERRVAGGSRSQTCILNRNNLTALMPKNSLALTASASPTFFFYLPPTTEPQPVEFVLRDGDDNLLYETTFTVSNKSGIISFTLPTSETTDYLKNNRDYHWYFSLICNRENRSQDMVVEGFVRRVEISSALALEIERSQPSERLDLYLEAGLWHEALAVMAQLQRSERIDLAISEKWSKMLHSIELDSLAAEPFINSYIGNSQVERILTSR